MQAQTVAVIGGGVVGLTTALALQSPTCEVVLVERDAVPARQSSWAGGGIVCPLWPWREPDALWDWVAQARRLYPRWAAQLRDETGIDVEYRQSGIEWRLPLLEREEAIVWLSARGLSVERRPEGLYCADLGQVRNPRLGRALAEAFTRRGGRLLCGRAGRPWQLDGALRGVQLQDGRTVAADQVVLCAGAWAGELLPPGQGANIFPVKGQMLLKRVSGARQRPVTIGASAYLVPRADDHVLIGSTVEHVGFDTQTTAQARQTLLLAADELAPWQRDAPVIGQWAGLRPGTDTSLPQVGPGPVRGLWLNLGHYRNGITLAPASAERLCAAMGYQSNLLPS